MLAAYHTGAKRVKRDCSLAGAHAYSRSSTRLWWYYTV